MSDTNWVYDAISIGPRDRLLMSTHELFIRLQKYTVTPEQKLMILLMGLDPKYGVRDGVKSSINTHFNGTFGETAVLGLVKDFI